MAFNGNDAAARVVNVLEFAESVCNIKTKLINVLVNFFLYFYAIIIIKSSISLKALEKQRDDSGQKRPLKFKFFF